jgi:nickel-dependent lactate racemase
MQPESLTLPWGRETIRVPLAAGWKIEGVLEPASRPSIDDIDAETRRALQSPIGSPRLSELYRVGMQVALVIDDGSRPTPVKKILPAVLEELKSAGLSWKDLTVIPALGLHRAMEKAEIAQRIGFQDMEDFRWENPECDNPEKLFFLGTTTRGTPVWVNKSVGQADLVVSIGCIEPHIIASFGGGYKNIFPGVAGRATVAHNHSLNCHPDTFNMVGQPIERNPMRLDLEESGKMIKAPVFIINAVLNSATQAVCVVAGDPIQAHRVGAQVSAEIFGVCIPGQADVVITDSHPMDSDLRQGVKALANTIRAVKPGGSIITLVRAEEGVGVFGLANRKLPLGRKALGTLAPILVRLVPKLKLKGMGEEDRFFLYFALQAMRLADMIMVAPTIPESTQENLPFVRFSPSIETAVEMVKGRVPKNATTLIFPHGGTTYPICS